MGTRVMLEVEIASAGSRYPSASARLQSPVLAPVSLLSRDRVIRPLSGVHGASFLGKVRAVGKLKTKGLGARVVQKSPQLPACMSSVNESVELSSEIDYYELLLLPGDASFDDIKRHYRWLQKRCHPDVAGDLGHDMAILLNQAYETLTDPNKRAAYDRVRATRAAFADYTGVPRSVWMGSPEEDTAVFVDEMSCIGCIRCALVAPKTFAIERGYGKARVTHQWAESDKTIQEAMKACPVSCIHWIPKEQLAPLEYVMSKQRGKAVGVDRHSGGGAKRDIDIFRETGNFVNKLKDRDARTASAGESQAQREARARAADAILHQTLSTRVSWWARFSSPTTHTPRPADDPTAGALVIHPSVKATGNSSGAAGSSRRRGDSAPASRSAADAGMTIEDFDEQIERLKRAAAARQSSENKEGATSSQRSGVLGSTDEYWRPTEGRGWSPASENIDPQNPSGTGTQRAPSEPQVDPEGKAATETSSASGEKAKADTSRVSSAFAAPYGNDGLGPSSGLGWLYLPLFVGAVSCVSMFLMSKGTRYAYEDLYPATVNVSGAVSKADQCRQNGGGLCRFGDFTFPSFRQFLR